MTCLQAAPVPLNDAQTLPNFSRFTSTPVDLRREGSEPLYPEISQRWPASSRAAKGFGQRRFKGSNPSLSAKYPQVAARRRSGSWRFRTPEGGIRTLQT